MLSQLENTVSSALSTYQQNRFLVAVSGGADSIALLSSLCSSVSRSASSAVKDVYVLHVDHGLRGQESTDDAEFVFSFCEEKQIPCKIVKIPPGKIEAYAKKHRTGLEAAARHFRRKALLKEAHSLDNNTPQSLILTAHTKDDALELILMRILRGGGPAGLALMPVKRGRFVRPLLGTTREEVIAYLKENNIPWREDSSNKDEKFLRNKIRHKLIPFLTELTENTEWKKGVENMAVTQSLVTEFLTDEVKQRIKWGQGSGVRGQCLYTDEKFFFAQPLIIREESIFKGLNLIRFNSMSFGAKIPKRYVIRRFCQGEQNSCDLGKARIIRKNGKITLTLVQKDFSEEGISYIIR